jgi:ASC-1-like (ASCH) protein
MNIFSINIQEPYRSLVLKGKKTVEGRLNRGKFTSIKVGDVLELEPDKVRFEVVGKNNYPSFREMIEKEGIENVLPDKDNIEEAVNVYYRFFTKEQENEFGVVAIRIKRK